MSAYIELFSTPLHERTRLNCVRFCQVDQQSGVCERDDTEQRPNDTCSSWDGE